MIAFYVAIWLIGVLGGVLIGYGFADWIERWHDGRGKW